MECYFKAAKIDDEHDPVELWNQHRRSFEKRVNYLNSLNLKKLYYKNSKGTEITIGLNDDYLFAGGGSYLKMVFTIFLIYQQKKSLHHLIRMM